MENSICFCWIIRQTTQLGVMSYNDRDLPGKEGYCREQLRLGKVNTRRFQSVPLGTVTNTITEQRQRYPTRTKKWPPLIKGLRNLCLDLTNKHRKVEKNRDLFLLFVFSSLQDDPLKQNNFFLFVVLFEYIYLFKVLLTVRVVLSACLSIYSNYWLGLGFA